MKLRKSELVIFGIVVLAFAVSIMVYPSLPERVASHWNIHGVVDGTMPRFWGAFFMPLLSLVFAAVFMVLPKIDPKRENIETFRGYFDQFIIAIFLFLFYIDLLTISWNIGYRFAMIQWISPAFGALFYSMGILVAHAKPNWTIGIRTPWTLSSDIVWAKTHALGGKLFKISGIIALFGTFFPSVALWFVLIPAVTSAIVALIYSYIAYRSSARQ